MLSSQHVSLSNSLEKHGLSVKRMCTLQRWYVMYIEELPCFSPEIKEMCFI